MKMKRGSLGMVIAFVQFYGKFGGISIKLNCLTSLKCSRLSPFHFIIIFHLPSILNCMLKNKVIAHLKNNNNKTEYVS